MLLTCKCQINSLRGLLRVIRQTRVGVVNRQFVRSFGLVTPLWAAELDDTNVHSSGMDVSVSWPQPRWLYNDPSEGRMRPCDTLVARALCSGLDYKQAYAAARKAMA